MKTKKEIRLENALSLFRASGLSNKEFAEAVELSASYWGQIKGGKGIGDSIAGRFEEAFKKVRGWMDHDHDITSNVSYALQQQGKVPVISWVKAGEWSEIVDTNEPGYADEWVTRINGGDNVYALRVDGDSMTAPPGAVISFPDGYVIHVDPSQKPENGDCVIAKLEDHSDAIFKQFKIEGGRPFLKSLNPAYPPIFDEFTLLGRVIGASIKL